jgi:hypothetical protein
MAAAKRPGRKTLSIPITGRSLFISEAKTPIESDNPDITRLELFRVLGAQWDQMDDTERAKYEKKADYLRRTMSRTGSSAHKDDTAERRPKISAFSVFTREQHELLKQSQPELTVTDRASMIAGLWKAMSKSDKIPFINAAKRETRSIRRPLPEEESESDDESQ